MSALPFCADPAGGAALVTATTVSQRTALVGNGSVIRVVNAGSGVVFINFGGSDVVATLAHMALPSGRVENFSIHPSSVPVTHVAFITSSGTAVCNFVRGEFGS